MVNQNPPEQKHAIVHSAGRALLGQNPRRGRASYPGPGGRRPLARRPEPSATGSYGPGSRAARNSSTQVQEFGLHISKGTILFFSNITKILM
ncbi:hypothetical protein BDA96_01G359400 [Sorghum bicolor]|uniref:Uncharacterized protein n=1 Tax=Sorghum bicolor TaxID=4558 RepID=A0A921S230_SORBI|nr:hypothetical protein BDA96_01G359400 [Sorghum bicolor]